MLATQKEIAKNLPCNSVYWSDLISPQFKVMAVLRTEPIYD